MIEKSIIDALVANPSETLAVEIKRWIDPATAAGIEKIIKARSPFAIGTEVSLLLDLTTAPSSQT
jgi:hypothetical protein